jgi:hypothetical protein
MEDRARKLTGSSKSKADTFDLDTLLHPASAFVHPMDVVRDADLTLNEKRAILASWASDACAVEAAPDLRANATGTTSWMRFASLTAKQTSMGSLFRTTNECWRERARVCSDQRVCVRATGTITADY